MAILRRQADRGAQPKVTTHIVNVSGGKDSTATYLLALQRGREFRAVFADTGNEHPLTYEFIESLPNKTGGPVVEVVKADFAQRMERRRGMLDDLWSKERRRMGKVYPAVERERIAKAKAAIQPTGNPFLDLCLLKGSFPSNRIRFCTQELKVIPIVEQIVLPALDQGSVIQWMGVRRDESKARANTPTFTRERVRFEGSARSLVKYYPLAAWTRTDVFAFHAKHGIKPNPLYGMGAERVGCAPCIFSRKREIKMLALTSPDEIARIDAWEKRVTEVSRRGRATFFPGNKTTKARHLKLWETFEDYPDGVEAMMIAGVIKWALDGSTDTAPEQSELNCEAGFCE